MGRPTVCSQSAQGFLSRVYAWGARLPFTPNEAGGQFLRASALAHRLKVELYNPTTPNNTRSPKYVHTYPTRKHRPTWEYKHQRRFQEFQLTEAKDRRSRAPRTAMLGTYTHSVAIPNFQNASVSAIERGPRAQANRPTKTLFRVHETATGTKNTTQKQEIQKKRTHRAHETQKHTIRRKPVWS